MEAVVHVREQANITWWGVDMDSEKQREKRGKYYEVEVSTRPKGPTPEDRSMAVRRQDIIGAGLLRHGVRVDGVRELSPLHHVRRGMIDGGLVVALGLVVRDVLVGGHRSEVVLGRWVEGSSRLLGPLLGGICGVPAGV